MYVSSDNVYLLYHSKISLISQYQPSDRTHLNKTKTDIDYEYSPKRPTITIAGISWDDNSIIFMIISSNELTIQGSSIYFCFYEKRWVCELWNQIHRGKMCVRTEVCVVFEDRNSPIAEIITRKTYKISMIVISLYTEKFKCEKYWIVCVWYDQNKLKVFTKFFLK